jgi:hypothetical protein
VSPHEAVAAERARLRVMLLRQVEYAWCEHCQDDTEHFLEEDGGECLPCEKARIESMAEAANDVSGYAAWKAGAGLSVEEPGTP